MKSVVHHSGTGSSGRSKAGITRGRSSELPARPKRKEAPGFEFEASGPQVVEVS